MPEPVLIPPLLVLINFTGWMLDPHTHTGCCRLLVVFSVVQLRMCSMKDVRGGEKSLGHGESELFCLEVRAKILWSTMDLLGSPWTSIIGEPLREACQVRQPKQRPHHFIS